MTARPYLGSRALVLGAGIAGIAAAAALRPWFDNVTILERDHFPDGPAGRRGVGQDSQLHNLLGCAQVHLDRLLPGFSDALAAAGAASARVAHQTHVYELGVRMPERDLGLRLMSAPRPTIEHCARRLLLADDGVTIREATRAIGLVGNPSVGVTGVAVSGNSEQHVVDATVVVDATGSGSQALAWLSDLEAEVPTMEVSPVAQWYCSTVFERPPHQVGAADFWLIFPTSPRTRGGLVSPEGPNHWCVSLSGHAQDEPPRTIAQVRAFAATLEDPWLAELLGQARPAGHPKLFRKPTATWRRYDRLARPLTGFLPIGDAVASLNPLFGQGMSVAAWQAGILSGVLEGPAGTVAQLTESFLRQAARPCQTAWDLGEIVNHPTAAPGGSTAALVDRIRTDPDFHRHYVAAWHLLEHVGTNVDPSPGVCQDGPI